MGVKVMVETQNAADKSLEYPVIMVAPTSGNVVLFTERNTGVVIKENHHYQVGHTVDNWISAEDTDVWEKFEGTITLSQTNEVDTQRASVSGALFILSSRHFHRNLPLHNSLSYTILFPRYPSPICPQNSHGGLYVFLRKTQSILIYKEIIHRTY